MPGRDRTPAAETTRRTGARGARFPRLLDAPGMPASRRSRRGGRAARSLPRGAARHPARGVRWTGPTAATSGERSHGSRRQRPRLLLVGLRTTPPEHACRSRSSASPTRTTPAASRRAALGRTSSRRAGWDGRPGRDPAGVRADARCGHPRGAGMRWSGSTRRSGTRSTRSRSAFLVQEAGSHEVVRPKLLRCSRRSASATTIARSSAQPTRTALEALDWPVDLWREDEAARCPRRAHGASGPTAGLGELVASAAPILMHGRLRPAARRVRRPGRPLGARSRGRGVPHQRRPTTCESGSRSPPTAGREILQGGAKDEPAAKASVFSSTSSARSLRMVQLTRSSTSTSRGGRRGVILPTPPAGRGR